MIKRQLQIIAEFNAIVNAKPPGYYKQNPLPFSAYDLLDELEKMGTEPIIAEREYFRKKYLAALSKNIPNLNEHN